MSESPKDLLMVKCPACNLSNVILAGTDWECSACDAEFSSGETLRSMSPTPITLLKLSGYIAKMELRNERLEAVREAAEWVCRNQGNSWTVVASTAERLQKALTACGEGKP